MELMRYPFTVAPWLPHPPGRVSPRLGYYDCDCDSLIEFSTFCRRRLLGWFPFGLHNCVCLIFLLETALLFFCCVSFANTFSQPISSVLFTNVLALWPPPFSTFVVRTVTLSLSLCTRRNSSRFGCCNDTDNTTHATYAVLARPDISSEFACIYTTRRPLRQRWEADASTNIKNK